jgi:putative nucleotidyltransferase with HDIG domain
MPENKMTAEYLIPISKNEVTRFTPLPADFYIKLGDDNFVLAGRRGDKALQDLQSLKKDSSIFELFVRREEYKNCVGASLQIAEVVISYNEISDLKKVSFLFSCSEQVFKEIAELGFSHETMAHSQHVSRSLITLIAAREDLNTLLSTLADQDDELVKHSMSVSAVSVAIAWQMGWTIQATLEKLALGGLLHDIGMKEIPPEIAIKPRFNMNATEVRTYESHVSRSVEILSQMPSVPAEVIAVAMEHHENALGQGYPRHLRDVKMNPFSKIVALADTFCELSLKSPSNPVPRTAVDTVKLIELAMGQPFSKPAFQGLKQALSITGKAKGFRKAA